MSSTRPTKSHTGSRGYLRNVDLAKLAERLHQPPYEDLWRQLETRTLDTIAQVRETNFGISVGSLGWHSRTPMLHEAALLATLNRDDQAIAYIQSCIEFTAAYEPTTERDHLLHSHAQIAIAADMVRSQLSEKTLNTLCQFMREVALPFNDPDPANLGPLGNNIHWVKSTQTAICALLWGEDSKTPNWQATVDQGIRHTQGYLRYGQDEQGHSYEGTGYGQSVLRFMFPFVELLKLTDYANLYLTEPGLLTAANASLHSMFPDQTFLTNDNDHGLSAASSLAYLLLTHQAYENANHLAAWYAYQGPQHPIRPFGDQEPWLSKQLNQSQPKPEDNASLFLACLYWNADTPYTMLEENKLPTTQLAQGTGKLNVRTSWRKDAVFLQFLGAGRSHMSQTHRHADAGHFSIFAHGDYLAIDTGRYNSDEDQHSVMLVDGEGHAPVAPGWHMDHHAGRLENFTQQKPITYACADMANIKGCYWAKRHLLAVDYSTDASPDQMYNVMVDDINKDNQHHDFWWQLQAHPDTTIEIQQAGAPLEGGGPHATIKGGRARLDLHFVSPQTAEDATRWPLSIRQDVKEWHWPYGQDRTPNALDEAGLLLTSVRRPRLIAELHQQGGRMLSLISPRPKNEPAHHVTRTHTAHVMGMQIKLGSFTDTILTSPSRGFIDTPLLSCMTELLWFRKDDQGKVIQQWTLDNEAIAWK